TTLPRRSDSAIVRPAWSVRVKPGAWSCGSGVSSISLARLVETLAGMPEGRGRAAVRWRRTTNVAAATATMTTTAIAPSTRRRPPWLAGRPGPGSCWPGWPAAPPPADCWPGVAPVVMRMLFLARPVGRPARFPSIAAPAAAGPASGRLAADEEHRRVVVERVADVAQHLRAQCVQDLVGGAGLADGAGLGEREELTGPAAGLADPVGVEQTPVARAGLDHGRPARRAGGGRVARLAGPGGELRQAERQAALGDLQQPWPLTVHQQRRGMSPVEQFHLGPVRADLPDDGGHELLIGELAGQRGLDPGRDHGEVGRVRRHLTERTEDGRRQLHGGQALALDIPDDEPGGIRRRDDLVEVAADGGPRRGGDVPDRYPDRAGLGRHRPEQDLLG